MNETLPYLLIIIFKHACSNLNIIKPIIKEILDNSKLTMILGLAIFKNIHKGFISNHHPTLFCILIFCK
jgi:hypothetical protein